MKVLITTVPFGTKTETADNLEAAGIEYLINPLGQSLRKKN